MNIDEGDKPRKKEENSGIMKKEKVTKFDLEDAFKALDDYEYPKVKGLRPNRENIRESAKRVDKTEILMEEYYSLTDKEDLEDATEEREAEIAKAKLARIEKIVDIDAQTEDDVLPSYVGKTIVQCPQCMTLYYRNPEDLVKSEEDPDVVNVGEQCPNCGNVDGFSVIGKVAAEAPEEIPSEPAPEAEEELASEPAAEEPAVEESAPEAEPTTEPAAEEPAAEPAAEEAPEAEDLPSPSDVEDEKKEEANESLKVCEKCGKSPCECEKAGKTSLNEGGDHLIDGVDPDDLDPDLRATGYEGIAGDAESMMHEPDSAPDEEKHEAGFRITDAGYAVDDKTYNDDGSWRGKGTVYGIEDGDETVDDFSFCYDPSTETVSISQEDLEMYSPDEIASIAEILADNIKTNEGIIEEDIRQLHPRYDSRKSFYGKAIIEEKTDGSSVLYSYSTPVCRIKDGKVTLLRG